MKRSNLFISLTIALGLGSSAVAAKAPEGPKPPAQVQTLKRLVGRWQGSFQYNFGGQNGTATAIMDCSAAAGSLGVSCKSTLTGLPGGACHEQDLFGYDAGGNKFHWFSVTSMGETHDHVAEPSKNGQLTWVYRGLSEGKPFKETIFMKMAPSGRETEFKNETVIGGKLVGSFHGTVEKR